MQAPRRHLADLQQRRGLPAKAERDPSIAAVENDSLCFRRLEALRHNAQAGTRGCQRLHGARHGGHGLADGGATKTDAPLFGCAIPGHSHRGVGRSQCLALDRGCIKQCLANIAGAGLHIKGTGGVNAGTRRRARGHGLQAGSRCQGGGDGARHDRNGLPQGCAAKGHAPLVQNAVGRHADGRPRGGQGLACRIGRRQHSGLYGGSAGLQTDASGGVGGSRVVQAQGEAATHIAGKSVHPLHRACGNTGSALARTHFGRQSILNAGGLAGVADLQSTQFQHAVFDRIGKSDGVLGLFKGRDDLPDGDGVGLDHLDHRATAIDRGGAGARGHQFGQSIKYRSRLCVLGVGELRRGGQRAVGKLESEGIRVVGAALWHQNAQAIACGQGRRNGLRAQRDPALGCQGSRRVHGGSHEQATATRHGVDGDILARHLTAKAQAIPQCPRARHRDIARAEHQVQSR